MALFSHVNGDTGRIHIHVAPTAVREREREEATNMSFYFPPLFLHLFPELKNTPF